ncbi:MAG: hypothetical protein ACRBCL_11710 [Maritimibacter sp.]
MTNKIAIGLLVLIIAFILLDVVLWGGQSPLFLARKFFVFLDWIAFWR